MTNLLNEIMTAYSMLEFSNDSDVDRKRKYLDEIKEYALSGVYTNTKHKEYFLRNFMKPVSEQKKDLGLSSAAVYKNRNLINRDLERRIGKDIVKQILTGDYDEVERVLNYSLLDQPIGKVVLQSVVDAIEERKLNEGKVKPVYDLEDCIDEIKLLKRYSFLDMELTLDSLNISKLKYLLRLINFKETNVKDRGRLLELIKR